MRNFSFLRFVGIGGDVHKAAVDHISRLSYPNQFVALTHLIQYLIAQSRIDPYVPDCSNDEN
jgi:DNA repair ATPase RecN